MTLYARFGKRLLDVLVSFLGLVILSPFLVIIALLLAIANRDNPFFRQQRPGRGGKVFVLLKFKTMNDRRDDKGQLLPDAERLTGFGKIIRKTSLDELPQLWNVLKGDMSLIGPRPLLVEYLPLYSEEQSKRHLVRPGITGWAQVNGRNALSWEEKFAHNVWYVENLSLALDIKIIGMTIVKVFKGEGISSGTSVTMEKFRGTK
ncbi:sugar transferase [Persicitalea jodogahamensis]|uniref:Sugar transferase n=1 Tax=Persicitalea jodogahamensis TaxID=402147 RepID=A0A8J3D3V9_9BACT|nr:sugar transferase [Persicitalea jodogahamensis]GHB54815.1 sugar transferase [Persicitalea jodogahamensis]